MHEVMPAAEAVEWGLAFEVGRSTWAGRCGQAKCSADQRLKVSI